MKKYSVRKMGMRLGKPHYGSECNICRKVLVVAYTTKELATLTAQSHIKVNH